MNWRITLFYVAAVIILLVLVALKAFSAAPSLLFKETDLEPLWLTYKGGHVLDLDRPLYGYLEIVWLKNSPGQLAVVFGSRFDDRQWVYVVLFSKRQ